MQGEESEPWDYLARALRIQFSDSKATVQCLEFENEHLDRQLNEACDASYLHEGQCLKNGWEQDAQAR
jgi:hypothetical protein